MKKQMSKMGLLSLLTFAALALALPFGVRAAESVNATGNWTVTQGGDYWTRQMLSLKQDGDVVVGAYGPHGVLHGKFATPTRMDATWKDPRGAGWMTLNFALNGKSFSGEWGYHGRKPSGNLIGKKVPTSHPATK